MFAAPRAVALGIGKFMEAATALEGIRAPDDGFENEQDELGEHAP